MASNSQFILPDDQPVVRLDAATAFNLLGAREQLYSHYLSRASWYGGLVVLLQTSPESPSIFRLLLRLARAQDTASLRAAAIAAGLNDQQVNAFFVYCSGFLSNMGNYKGFGDSKFVPNLPVEALETLVKASEAYKADQGVVGGIWEDVKGPMYSLKDLEKQLGLGKKGITKYFTPNCDLEDSELVNRFFKTKSLEGYINRVIKTVEGGKTCYEIRNAGVADTVQIEEDFEGCKMKVTTGDYQGLLDRVAINLGEAAKHAANSDEANMLKEYVASFKEGSLDKHKEGSRYWIKNKGPLVETYIGFIETYRDPAGMRGEFEGFVAMVNKQMSEKFQVLVDRAEEMLPMLPWPKEFEKDEFLRPDFTSLDVPTFEVQVGLHELLGHGSGKLFYKGNFPESLVNPLTKEAVAHTYGPGETYDSVFTSLGSSYEECRAECVGIHLCLEPGVCEIFGHSGAEAEDIKYANWLSMVHAGLKGLEMFSPASQEWKQAHSQARFVIMQVMLEAGQDFLTIKECTGEDGKPDMLITMDRSKVATVGQPAIASFLQKLQVYKATADISAAKQMYDKYSEVSEPWASRRDIVVARKQARMILVQANTNLVDEKLELVQYDPSPEGMVKSWAERFPDFAEVDAMLDSLAARDAKNWA